MHDLFLRLEKLGFVRIGLSIDNMIPSELVTYAAWDKYPVAKGSRPPSLYGAFMGRVTKTWIFSVYLMSNSSESEFEFNFNKQLFETDLVQQWIATHVTT